MYVFGHFLRVLPPVLVSEVLADLSKQDASASSPEELVKRLARKFIGSGPPLHVGHSSLLRNDLMGDPVAMTGQSYPAGARVVPPHGRYGAGLYIDMTSTNEDVYRWGRGQFLPEEREIAASWRVAQVPFPAEELNASLEDREVAIPRIRNIEEMDTWVRASLSNRDLGSLWVDWLAAKAELSDAAKAAVFDRWLRRPVPLQTFTPYGHHCMKVDLSFIVASRFKLIPIRKTDLLDVQYLYYLPFCHGFVSDDKLHQRLAPLCLRPNQQFVLGQDLKADIHARITEPSSGKTEPGALAFGTRPAVREDSIVSRLWESHIGPSENE
jgi:hypothetical protein